MATESTLWSQQYTNNILIAAGQVKSALRQYVDERTFKGEREFVDYYGHSEAVEIEDRYSDTPNIDVPVTRRSVTTTPIVWSKLVDRSDTVRSLADPSSKLVEIGGGAIARKIDDKIIAAFDGTAYTGKDGTTSTSFDSNNSIAANYGGAAANLTITKLLQARYLLDTGNANPLGKQIYCAVGPSQIKSLLGTTQVTSSDYNTVKALVNGEIDTFLGIKFITSTRLPKASNDRSCFVWVEDAIVLGVRDEITGRVSERDDKNYAQQIYFRIDVGASRMEEAKVVRIYCDESV